MFAAGGEREEFEPPQSPRAAKVVATALKPPRTAGRFYDKDREGKRDRKFLDASGAQAIAKPRQGALLKNVRAILDQKDEESSSPSLSDQTRPLRTIDGMFEEVYADVSKDYLPLRQKTDRIECLKEKKTYWQKQLSRDISAETFSDKIWQRVRKAVNDARKSATAQDMALAAEEVRNSAVNDAHGQQQIVEGGGADVGQTEISIYPAESAQEERRNQTEQVSSSVQYVEPKSEPTISDPFDFSERDYDNPVGQRWAHLSPGVLYDGSEFVFDEWDSYEKVL